MTNAAVYYHDGGAYRCIESGVSFKDSGGTVRTITNVYYHDGSAWREVHRVYQQSATVIDQDTGSNAVTAEVLWNNSGDLILTGTGGGSDGFTTDWLWPAGTAPTALEYFIRHTLLSGDTPTSANPPVSTVGSLSSSVNRLVKNTISGVSGPGTVTSTVLTEIATDVGMTNIVSAGTFVVTAVKV